MANAVGGILFHCQEGKDRTGIISTLSLLLAGVPDVDIYMQIMKYQMFICTR